MVQENRRASTLRLQTLRHIALEVDGPFEVGSAPVGEGDSDGEDQSSRPLLKPP